MPNYARILLFHVEPDKASLIENLSRKFKVHISKIQLPLYSQKLGYLAGISGFNKENTTYTGPDFPLEMMIFSGMDSDMLDHFLAEYKKASIPPIRLKAILTQHNIFWSAEDLYRELFKESLNFRSFPTEK